VGILPKYSKGESMKNILPLDLSLEQPENFFSINNFLPDDGNLSKLISIHISALDLANHINPKKIQWIKIDTIFLEARLKDVLELVPDAKPYIDNMTSDRIVTNLPADLSLTLLTKLKQENKFYKISTSKIPGGVKITSKVSSRDWASAVEDVRDNNQYLSDYNFINRRIKRIVVNFYDFDDSLNKSLLDECLKKLDFYKDNQIQYEYNYDYSPSKYLIQKYIIFWPMVTGCPKEEQTCLPSPVSSF
jgi:hypothetical protein